jgi:excinuclease ABC subunit C
MSLRDIQKNLPQQTGVYMFLDEKNKPIYIGKAKNLRKRTAYYFKTDGIPKRLKRMAHLAVDLKYFITDNEQDAFLLEAELIKQNKPVFNILYQNGRPLTYIYFSDHAFPKLEIVKEWKPGSLGPFLSGEMIRNIMREITRIFKIRVCSDYVFARRKRPCMEYFAHRCTAPCVGLIDPEAYSSQMKQLKDLFNGKIALVLSIFKKNLKAFVEKEEFERARDISNQILAIEKLKEKQSIYFHGVKDLDLIIKYKKYFYVESIRNGAVNHIHYRKYEKTIFFEEFLWDLYIEEPNFRVISEYKVESVFKNYSNDLSKQEKVLLAAAKRRMLNLVADDLSKDSWHDFFGLQKLDSIEVYDCSHYSGKSAIGAMIFSNKEEFIKSNYRYWKMNFESQNDLAILEQTLLRRAKNENFPDMILIDGGKTQLNVALRCLYPFENVFAFAKGLNRKGGVVYSKNGIVPINDEKLFLWLESLRDEAHRWAKKNASLSFGKNFIKGSAKS